MKKLLFLVVLAGCTSDGAQVNITKTVGAEGGTVSQSDGTSVEVPPGALSSNANITITSVSVTPPTGFVLVGPAYDFGPEGTTFSSPVTITLPFDMSKIPSGLTTADIRIFTAPKGSTNYTQVTTSLGSGVVTTQAAHFTVYFPATPAKACTPSCTQNAEGCSCTATCNSQMNLVQCFGGSGGPTGPTGPSSVSCYCEIDGQTQSTLPSISSCDQIMMAYNQCFNG